MPDPTETEAERRAAERLPLLTALRDATATAIEAATRVKAATPPGYADWLLDALTDARDGAVALLADPVPVDERDGIAGDLAGDRADEWRGAAE